DKITQCTSVDADCRGDGWLKTADEFRAWAMTTSFVKDSAQPYDALPGGVISIVSSGSDEGSGGYFSTTYCILFWKSPQCWGFVTTDAGASCSEKCRAEHEAMCAFARSECERLAKIVYDRLPTGDEAMLRAQDDIETAKTIRDNTKPSEEEKAAYVCRSAGISCPGLEENPGLFDIEEIDSYPDKERDYTHWSHVVEKMETEFRQKHYVEVHNIFMTGYEEYAEYY
ncbi:MAG TPA: hypothetical protein P5510_06620, partial [Clostridia bacterium]|nr:hypothetical protein [Clostridia bacterium]